MGGRPPARLYFSSLKKLKLTKIMPSLVTRNIISFSIRPHHHAILVTVSIVWSVRIPVAVVLETATSGYPFPLGFQIVIICSDIHCAYAVACWIKK